MTVKALKKNNMARTSKSRGASTFKLRSQGSTFKMIGSSSPLRGKKEDKAKQESMNAVHKSITGDMTDQQLRDIAVSQHGGQANQFNVDIKYLKKLRTLRKGKGDALKESSAESTTSEVVAPPTLQESRDDVFGTEKEGTLLGDSGLSAQRKKALKEASKSGYMRKLREAVAKKYGGSGDLASIDDPEDRQMAGDAMIDDQGNILPMSSASGQYSGGALLKRYKKRKK